MSMQTAKATTVSFFQPEPYNDGHDLDGHDLDEQNSKLMFGIINNYSYNVAIGVVL